MIPIPRLDPDEEVVTAAVEVVTAAVEVKDVTNWKKKITNDFRNFWERRAKPFIIVNFLPLGFLFSLILALSYPFPVFFISSVTLNTTQLWNAIREYRALIIGLLTILCITPLFAFITIQIPFHPPEFAVGLSIFVLVPTTLGVGVALTTASEGK